jgi:hypothetical protein
MCDRKNPARGSSSERPIGPQAIGTKTRYGNCFNHGASLNCLGMSDLKTALSKKLNVSSETPRKALDRQTRRLRDLFDKEMSRTAQPLGQTLARPETVLSFAEDLMLCPNEESALKLIQRDLEASRGLLLFSTATLVEVERGNARIEVSFGQNETPFCLVAGVARQRAQEAIADYEDSWFGPGFSIVERVDLWSRKKTATFS